jgi:hypothetical protein
MDTSSPGRLLKLLQLFSYSIENDNEYYMDVVSVNLDFDLSSQPPPPKGGGVRQ